MHLYCAYAQIWGIILSILGVVVRVRPENIPPVVERLSTLPGADVSLNPGDGRLVMVIEDAEVSGVVHSAAATMAAIALWPDVLNTSLVYEYSGPDAPPLGEAELKDYRDWRGSLAAPQPSQSSPPAPLGASSKAPPGARMENTR